MRWAGTDAVIVTVRAMHRNSMMRLNPLKPGDSIACFTMDARVKRGHDAEMLALPNTALAPHRHAA